MKQSEKVIYSKLNSSNNSIHGSTTRLRGNSIKGDASMNRNRFKNSFNTDINLGKKGVADEYFPIT